MFLLVQKPSLFVQVSTQKVLGDVGIKAQQLASPLVENRHWTTEQTAAKRQQENEVLTCLNRFMMFMLWNLHLKHLFQKKKKKKHVQWYSTYFYFVKHVFWWKKELHVLHRKPAPRPMARVVRMAKAYRATKVKTCGAGRSKKTIFQLSGKHLRSSWWSKQPLNGTWPPTGHQTQRWYLWVPQTSTQNMLCMARTTPGWLAQPQKNEKPKRAPIASM